MSAGTEYLFESFLTQFYLLDSILGDFIDESERRAIWTQLAAIFCIPEDGELEEYYRESSAAHYREVTDLASYGRLCRMIEYAEKSGQDIGVTSIDRTILARKRAAMQAKSEIFKQDKSLTPDSISAALMNTATDGCIASMTTLAYMEYNGICRCKDERTAVKRIRCCAKWNDLFGNLMGLAFDAERRDEYYNNLYTILRSADDKRLFTHICESTGYTGTPTKNHVARIIEKAFGMNIIQRGRYDRVFARAAFSELISAKDKEKLLLNKQKDAIASLSDLPFDAAENGTLSFDEGCADKLPLKRDAEIRRILQNFAVAAKCPRDVYTPLLIAANDRYIADMYGRMIRSGFGGGEVVEIDAGTLTEADFAGGRENVFLRGLSETKSARTVFIIRDCEELDDKRLSELEKVLDYEYRRRYKLFSPPVSVDISGILLVMLTSRKDSAVMRLAPHCDTVMAGNITSAEKNAAIDKVFGERSDCFGLAGMTLGEGAGNILPPMI